MVTSDDQTRAYRVAIRLVAAVHYDWLRLIDVESIADDLPRAALNIGEYCYLCWLGTYASLLATDGLLLITSKRKEGSCYIQQTGDRLQISMAIGEVDEQAIVSYLSSKRAIIDQVAALMLGWSGDGESLKRAVHSIVLDMDDEFRQKLRDEIPCPNCGAVTSWNDVDWITTPPSNEQEARSCSNCHYSWSCTARRHNDNEKD